MGDENVFVYLANHCHNIAQFYSTYVNKYDLRLDSWSNTSTEPHMQSPFVNNMKKIISTNFKYNYQDCIIVGLV